MDWLIDTGILFRIFHRTDPLHAGVQAAFLHLRGSGESLCTSPQNIAEFWSASTRPTTARGGYGTSIQDTEQRVRIIEQDLTVLADKRDVYLEWRRLVFVLGVSGVQVHEPRIAAIMRAYGISRLLTLNPRDFARYPGIVPLTPQQVLQPPSPVSPPIISPTKPPAE